MGTRRPGTLLFTALTLLFGVDHGSALAADCNSNGLDDLCDLSCGTTGGPCDITSCGLATDCNANTILDDCDLAAGTSIDCNNNSLSDTCDLAAGTDTDCDANAQPDDCDVAAADDCRFPFTLIDNTTGQPDAIYLGPPDDIFVGIGGQIVTYDFDCGVIYDGPGADFTVYEIDGGSAEFNTIDVLLSADGSTFTSVNFTQFAAVSIPGDEAHGSSSFARSYNLTGTGLAAIRFVRIDGNGTGGAGGSNAFDLDAIGAVNLLVPGDCDTNGILDRCDLDDGAADCNTNGIPDACELAVGAVKDCNANHVPDSCDLAGGTSADCNANRIPDACEPQDCNSNNLLDDCEIADGMADDCNSNGIPDTCDRVPGTVLFQPPPHFPLGAGFAASFTIPAPFLAAGPVTFDVTGLGDLSATNETVAIHLNGMPLGSVFSSGGADCLEIMDQWVISAELFNTIVGNQDAVIDLVPSSAVAFNTCLGSFMQLAVSYDRIADCNSNGQIDFCDIAVGTSTDINLTGLPDECDPDCNANGAPDDIDIAAGTSIDCNDNATPDECDLALGTSADCNGDERPDECPVCSTVEVVFIMDTSSSMTDEGAALCGTITQVAAELQADLVSVDVALLAISNTPSSGGIFGCLTDNVINLYGNVVPGSPPLNNEILGACPGGSQVPQEDWARATSVVAGQKNWLADSVRVIVPISDEGPWCGDPVSNPGVDRDSITHAIGVAQQNNVVVSPITGTGSSGAMIALAQELAAATGGTQFSSSLPAEDLALAIEQIVLDACGSDSDCNRTGVPDDCEIAAGSGADCDGNLRPDECDSDCNTNGVPDTCDLTGGTSTDCDANSRPDECDPDCNANGVPDTCDLMGATSVDCNLNDTPDECDLAGSTSNDCTHNGIPDACDLLAGTSADCNGNLRPDTCDLAPGPFQTVFPLSGPFGGTAPRSFVIPSALVAGSDVELTLTAVGDFENVNEFVTVDVNGDVLGTVFATGGLRCLEFSQTLLVAADSFNDAVGGGDAVITLTPTGAVNTNDCGGITYVILQVTYPSVPDCNLNGIVDGCDIAAGTSIDVDNNGQPDTCQPDCNNNAVPDRYEIIQATALDCNGNTVPDECDLAAATSPDCNNNAVPDECDDDCNTNGRPDLCDITGGTSLDCNNNGLPDGCELSITDAACRFPVSLAENTTGAADARFTGSPDDVFYGLGGQVVTYAFDCQPLEDRPGLDITVYEADTGGAEFGSIDVLVSANGTNFLSVKNTESTAVNIPGDEMHGSNSFARSYDLAGSGLSIAWFVRIDGAGTGAAGSTTGFDLDAVGAIHLLSPDCNDNGVPDDCDLATGTSADCNTNGIPDACGDIATGDCDCDGTVTSLDFAALAACVTGPVTNASVVGPCLCADHDQDGDVDLRDFALFAEVIDM